ncbi:hypothetical protein K1719_021057 [Acacia pycnantha]|nr:hypothetical protein K1719_021057 [Acacia pycnantha]
MLPTFGKNQQWQQVVDATDFWKESTMSTSCQKTAQIQTWVEESKMSPKEDGHAWRKYGQKIILNAKHPSFENNNHNNNNNNLIATVDPENNNNNSSFFVSSGSLFPSSSSVKKEQHCDNNIKQEKNNNYNDDEIINVVASCSSNNDCFVSHPHEEEVVLPAFGSGDYDQVDVFNSSAFYDPLGGFEDLLFEII